MPLIAKDKHTGERINILKLDNPRVQLSKDAVVCPLCDEPMFIAQGQIRDPYFSHYAERCNSDYAHKPESPEHRFFKSYLARELQNNFREYTDAGVVLELPVPSIHRVIDIAFEFPGGWIMAHEVQLSSITVKQIEERTNDYRSAGIDVHWWIGHQAATTAIKEWCFSTFGECHTLEYDRAREHIALYDALGEARG